MATVSCGGTSERYRFIQRLSSEISVKFLCTFLGVSRSGYYDWLKREPAKRTIEDDELRGLIQTVYDTAEERYGSPRVFNALKKQGIAIGRKRVERLMREMGLRGRVVKVTHRNPGLKQFLASGENLRLGMESVTGIDQVWVADITYLKVGKRWMYLSVIMDLYSRKIISWTLDHQRTTQVTKRTLKYALKNRRPETEVIFHTDRGIEYRGHVFQKALERHGLKHSLNRLGQCTDNSHMESFFHSMKAELIRGNRYSNEADLRYDLVKYINQFYNKKRLHSGIDYKTPVEYEALAA